MNGIFENDDCKYCGLKRRERDFPVLYDLLKEYIDPLLVKITKLLLLKESPNSIVRSTRIPLWLAEEMKNVHKTMKVPKE